MQKKVYVMIIVLVLILFFTSSGVSVFLLIKSEKHKNADNDIFLRKNNLKLVSMETSVISEKLYWNGSSFGMDQYAITSMINNSFLIIFDDVSQNELFYSIINNTMNWTEPKKIFSLNPHLSDEEMFCPNIIFKNNTYYLFYKTTSGHNNINSQIWLTKSTNGINWSPPIKINVSINSMLFLSNENIISITKDHIGEGTDIFISNDGINWNYNNIHDILFQSMISLNSGVFMGIDQNGYIYTSENLRDWNKKSWIGYDEKAELFEDSYGNIFVISGLKRSINSEQQNYIVLYFMNNVNSWSQPIIITTYSNESLLRDLSMNELENRSYLIINAPCDMMVFNFNHIPI